MIIEQGQFARYPINPFNATQQHLEQVMSILNGQVKIYPPSEILLILFPNESLPQKLKFYPKYFNPDLNIAFQANVPVLLQLDKFMMTRQDVFDYMAFLLFIHTGYLQVQNEHLEFLNICMMTVELKMPINFIKFMMNQLCNQDLFKDVNFKRKKALHMIIYLSENQYFTSLVQYDQELQGLFNILVNRITSQTVPLICSQENPEHINEYVMTAQRMNKFTYEAIVKQLKSKKGDDFFLQLYSITRLICLFQQEVNREIEMVYLTETLEYYKLEENPKEFYQDLSKNLKKILSQIFEEGNQLTYHIYSQCQNRKTFVASCGHQLCTFCTANYICYKQVFKNGSDNKLKQYNEKIRCPSRITDHRICDKCLTQNDIGKLQELLPQIQQFIK
ncbi:hypothetical protein pb186bvf_000894 [Paramecium bursaria]